MANFKGEKLHSESKAKEVYYYHDEVAKIKQISREVSKKNDEVIHYPRGYEGGEKYKTIKRFIFRGFKGKLPVGIIKSVTYGWGFTKTLNPLAFYINDNTLIESVVVEKTGKTELDIPNQILYLSEKSLETLNTAFTIIFRKNKEEVNHVLLTTLHELLPSVIEKPNKKYTSNALASSLATWGNSIDEFSDADKAAIKDLFDKLSLGTDFLSKESLARTKEIVDNKYIQETLKAFKQLMKGTTDGEPLEKRWQEFLKQNSWIFSSVFAQPVILYKKEAYVGGKTIDNKNGKFNDFLIKNSLSDNVSFIEIKTHRTKMLEKTPYRGNDVYSATKDLTGSIGQVLNQRDNFQKEYYQTKGKSKGENFETFNSKCIVIIGSAKELTEPQKYSFELFRSNSRDVEILTFDEVEKKIESLQMLMSDKPKANANAKPKKK